MSHWQALTEAAQEPGPATGWGQAAVSEKHQGARVPGQDEQPQGLAIHQGAPDPAQEVAAPQQQARRHVAQHHQEQLQWQLAQVQCLLRFRLLCGDPGGSGGPGTHGHPPSQHQAQR